MAKRGKELTKLSTDESTAMRPQPHGGALRNGGTNKGGPGRTPEVWKALCRELSTSKEVLEQARKVIKDKEHPAWLGAWRFLVEQGFGKPESEAAHITLNQVSVVYVNKAGS